jgi:hypothetical protein
MRRADDWLATHRVFWDRLARVFGAAREDAAEEP